MPHAVVVAPLALAVVLVLSAVAKLSDRTDATASVVQLLRLPAWVGSALVGRVLPWGELLLAALLVLAPDGAPSWVAGIGALGLMSAYWVVVVRAMGFDPRPSCGCFGRIGDQRITARTVWRNSLLVALAVVTVGIAATGHSTASLLRADAGPDEGGVWWWLLAMVLVAALTALVVGGGPAGEPDLASADAMSPTHTVRDGAAEEEGPDYQRRPIPVANLTDPAGVQHTLAELVRERAQLLVLVNCYCASSGTALASLPRWQERLPALDVRFVSSVPVQPLTGPTGQLATDTTWVDHGGVTWQAFGFTGRRPFGVLLGTDGLLAGGPVSGVEAIDEFVADIAEALSGR